MQWINTCWSNHVQLTWTRLQIPLSTFAALDFARIWILSSGNVTTGRIDDRTFTTRPNCENTLCGFWINFRIKLCVILVNDNGRDLRGGVRRPGVVRCMTEICEVHFACRNYRDLIALSNDPFCDDVELQLHLKAEVVVAKVSYLSQLVNPVQVGLTRVQQLKKQPDSCNREVWDCKNKTSGFQLLYRLRNRSTREPYSNMLYLSKKL